MTLILKLPPEREAILQAQAQSRGLTVEQWLLYLADQSSSVPRQTQVQTFDDRPIWEVIVDNMKDVPPEDLAALRKDGASQIDHYVYGVPKRD